MSLYLRSAITARIHSMLRQITRETGSRTDLGARIFVGQAHAINATDLPCFVLTPGDESGIDREAGLVRTSVSYSIGAFFNRLDPSLQYLAGPEGGAVYEKGVAAQDFDTESVLIEAAIADVRDRIESGWCPMSDLGATLTYVGAAPTYHKEGGENTSVEIRYDAIFSSIEGDFSAVP